MEQFLVIEVKDNGRLRNEYVSLQAHENDVRLAFQRMREDGIKPTRTISRAQRDRNGVMRRVKRFSNPLFERGFRTMSAFLRA
jgi:hypothetical protein